MRRCRSSTWTLKPPISARTGSRYGTGCTRYPLPAGCLLIGCSGVLVTIRIVNEMRLDYSPIYAGFAYKTTESLWNWCALLRCIVCSQDDAVLVHPELLVPVRCCGRWSETVRASCTSWCGDTRGLCVQKWFGLGDECTRLSFERRGAVLWTDPPAPVWTSVANCRHLRASCSQTVRMGWCKASGKVVTLVSAPNCAVGSDRSVHCAVQGCASNARGCSFRMQRERAADVRTSKLRPCPGCNGSHVIVATLG